MEVRVLGPLEVVVEGVLVALGSPKERALFALLAVQANKVVSVDRLADELWDGSPPDQAVAALRVYVSHLRKVLPDGVLVTRDPGYVLVVDPDRIDAARFESLLAQGRTELAGGNAAAAAATLTDALSRWRGSAFEGVQATVSVSAETSRLEEARVGALEDRIDADLQCGRHRELAGELSALIAEYPLRERLWSLLIVALYRCGRQADALRAYQQARTKLVEELGIEPGAELRRIEAMVLTQDSALDAPAAAAEVRHNLPASRTTFVGRDREIAAVTEALNQCRLVTLTGTGGVGKTRLAIEVAREVAPRFTDGVWFVEFGAIGDPRAVADVISRGAGIDPRQGMTITESLLDALRARRVLLVIDNCEHLVAAVAEMVVAIAIGCPNVTVLATSREALDVDGERIIAVAPLPADGTHSDAQRLFVERARDAGAQVAVDGDNGGAVAELCRRLDGIPLAIELAAARLRSMTAEELLTHIDERFRLLTVGRRGAVTRHQTLRRTLDWSHDLLDEEERVVFRRLAAFAGDFDRAAAQCVCEANFDMLGRLVDKSLLVTNQSGGVTRYRFLETTRDYAAEQLVASGDAERLARRHAEYFATLAAQVGAGLRGADEVRWVDRLNQDFDNVRAAVMWALETGDPDLATRAIAPFAQIGLYDPRLVAEWAEAAVSRFDSPDLELWPCVVALAGYAAGQRFDVEGALERAFDALDRARGMTPRAFSWTAPMALNALATMGRMDVQQALTDEWVGAALAADDTDGLVRALTQRFAGQAWRYLPVGSVEDGEAVVRMARTLAQPSGLALALCNIGMAYSTVDRQRCGRYLDEAMELSDQTGYTFGRCLTIVNFAQILFEDGDLPAAIEMAYSGLVAARTESRWLFIMFSAYLSCALADLGHPDDAAVVWHRAALVTGSHNPRLGGVLQRVTDLPQRLGQLAYDALVAKGEAMSEDELLEFARAAVERARASTA